MKRKQEKPAYDRIAAGERLRCRRLELGWSRELVAERLGVVNKYYADIERGTCGMSVETLINLSRLYGVSLDTLIYGEKETIPGKSGRTVDAGTRQDASGCTGLLPADVVAVCRRASGSTGGNGRIRDRKKQFGQRRKLRKRGLRCRKRKIST